MKSRLSTVSFGERRLGEGQMADNPNDKLMDNVVAEIMAMKVFMLEIAIQMGSVQDDKASWATQFISSLHSRIDAHEASVELGDLFGWHEGARHRLDLLGVQLRQALQV
jgi:hypothetical protein